MLSGDCNVCINRELPSNSATCVECGLSRKNYKPMTNADSIRSMSDEELANFLALQQINIVTAIYKAFDEPVPDAMTGAREEWLDWLKEEAKHE